jgi:hypothetical protein
MKAGQAGRQAQENRRMEVEWSGGGDFEIRVYCFH